MTIEIPKRFDDSLLSATEEQCISHITSKLIKHPLLEHALELSKDNIELAPAGEVVAIIGPSGVGTTTLARGLKSHYIKSKEAGEAAESKDLTRCLGMDAPISAGRIDKSYWKSLLNELLIRGGDILIDKKVYVPAVEFQLLHSVPPGQYSNMGDRTLVQATVAMLERRATRVVLINQAERLFPEGDKASCKLSQDMLRDLASRTQTRFVLVSNYQILKAHSLLDSFLQRKQIVHLRRYDCRVQEDLESFTTTLVQLLGNVPGPYGIRKLTADGAKQIYVNNVGCIGIQKNMILMSAGYAYRSKSKITLEMLLTCGQLNIVAQQRAREALEGELLLTDISPSEVERLLDGRAGTGVSATGAGRADEKLPKKGDDKPRTNFRKLAIGERKPTRDPVGGVNAKRA
nr:hypothetical protein [Rhodoferax sp.]